ncbi:MAG: signal peptidase I [Nitrospiraceae bacterium]|nr:signal peptidase I [Nitrospiraceae bacterium]
MTEPTSQFPEQDARAARTKLLTRLAGPLTRKNLLSWIGVILIVCTIRWAIFEPYKIPSGSMEPTLHGDERIGHGDRVGVNKWIYGLRIPFTKTRLFHLSEPQRWDIVVFKAVEENARHGTLIKRIVGLPGERIHIADGKIHVNGEAVEPPDELRDVLNYTTSLGQPPELIRSFILHHAQSNERSPLLSPANPTAQQFYEELAVVREGLGGRDPASLSASETEKLVAGLSPVSMNIAQKLFGILQQMQYPLKYGILPDDEFSVVPEDCYLVCGDNSPDSADGRYFGWLPNGHILGRAFCIGWPPSRWRDFSGFSRTWWGKGLLWGLPALVAVYVGMSFRGSRKRRFPRKPNA